MNDIIIRTAQPGDHEACEHLVRDAFWDLYRPGSVEHLILHNARARDDFVADLDLVAVSQGQVVGCIMATRAVVAGETRSSEVLVLGPLAVTPGRQREGIGGSLLRATLERAGERGFGAAFLYGSPEYYPRYGFRDAGHWGITTADGLNFDAFMGTEIIPGALADVQGRLLESAVFDVDPADLAEFDRRFPEREKHVTPTQLQH